MIHFNSILEKNQPDLKKGIKKLITYANFDILQAIIAMLQRKINAENMVKRAMKTYATLNLTVDARTGDPKSAQFNEQLWDRYNSFLNKELATTAWNEILYLISTSSETDYSYSLFDQMTLLLVAAAKYGIKIDKM